MAEICWECGKREGCRIFYHKLGKVETCDYFRTIEEEADRDKNWCCPHCGQIHDLTKGDRESMPECCQHFLLSQLSE